MLENTGHKAN